MSQSTQYNNPSAPPNYNVYSSEPNQYANYGYQPSNQPIPPSYTAYAAQQPGQPTNYVVYTTAAQPVPQYDAKVVVVTQPVAAPVPTKQSFTIHYLFSCFNVWFCWVLFGAISFFLTVSAKDKATSGDQPSSYKLTRLALFLNITGFFLGCVAWAVLIAWLVTGFDDDDCDYYINGGCYDHRYYTCSESYCRNYFSNSYYYSCYCYYN